MIRDLLYHLGFQWTRDSTNSAISWGHAAYRFAINILSLHPKHFERHAAWGCAQCRQRRGKMQVVSYILYNAYRFQSSAIGRGISDGGTNLSIFPYAIVHVPQHRAERFYIRSDGKSTLSTFVIGLLPKKRPKAPRTFLIKNLIIFDNMSGINQKMRHNIDALQHYAENLCSISRSDGKIHSADIVI